MSALLFPTQNLRCDPPQGISCSVPHGCCRIAHGPNQRGDGRTGGFMETTNRINGAVPHTLILRPKAPLQRWHNNLWPLTNLSKQHGTHRRSPGVRIAKALHEARDNKFNIRTQAAHCPHQAEYTISTVGLAIREDIKNDWNSRLTSSLYTHEGSQCDMDVSPLGQPHQIGYRWPSIRSQNLKTPDTGSRQLGPGVPEVESRRRAENLEPRHRPFVSNPIHQKRYAVRAHLAQRLSLGGVRLPNIGPTPIGQQPPAQRFPPVARLGTTHLANQAHPDHTHPRKAREDDSPLLHGPIVRGDSPVSQQL
jgi:hypothetical protein